MTRLRTPGHRMVRVGVGTWCSCGVYLGGLAFGDHSGLDTRTRYSLHRLWVHNAKAAPIAR